MEPLSAEDATITAENFDKNVLSVLPDVRKVVDVKQHGASAWARAFRVVVETVNDETQVYFMKVSVGHHGLEALKGEYESTASLYKISPGFTPKPLGWGSLESPANSHFYICKFHALDEELPEPSAFCERLAALHSNHDSPEGKYGFHVVTYNGDLPQDNSWTETWEEFFSNGFKHVVNVNVERAGRSAEMEALLPAFYEKVIPRLLRPLETGGNSIKPSLVHGDLWCGNAAVDQESEEAIIYDPSSFWAHNEYELGNWRPARNKWTRTYFNAYHAHYPKAQPEEDYDDRNLLYSMRFNLHAGTLFPDNSIYRESVIEDMRTLIERYPLGYQGP